MDNGRFIRCRNCDAVHHVTEWDRAAAAASRAGQTEPVDDWHAFMRAHAGHSLEPLTAVGEVEFVTGAVGDPMTVAHIRVTNGRKQFLLRRSRSNIAEPLKFELIDSI